MEGTKKLPTSDVETDSCATSALENDTHKCRPETPRVSYYEALITEAPLIYGDHGIPPAKLDLIHSKFNDPKLIASGKDFVRRNFYSVMLAHLVSLMWIFTFKPGRAVLLRTGESHNKDASLARYLSTVLHIKLWYESDFLERTARGSQDLYAVRKMHAAAAKNYTRAKPPSIPALTPEQLQILDAVRKSMTFVICSAPEVATTDDPQVPMSQFDMVITQFCFIGFLILMPEAYGVQDTEGLDGFVHLWAIFGRSLGIEDRFNLAIHYKESGGNLKDFRRIYEEIFLVNLKDTDETAVVMWESLIYGCSQYVKQLRLKPMIKFMVVNATGKEADGGGGKEFNHIMGWGDNISYKFLVFATQKLAKWKWSRELRNRAIRLSFHRAQRKFLPDWHKIRTPCPQVM